MNDAQLPDEHNSGSGDSGEPRAYHVSGARVGLLGLTSLVLALMVWVLAWQFVDATTPLREPPPVATFSDTPQVIQTVVQGTSPGTSSPTTTRPTATSHSSRQPRSTATPTTVPTATTVPTPTDPPPTPTYPLPTPTISIGGG